MKTEMDEEPLWVDDNQFQYASFAHEKLDFLLFVEQTDYW